MKVLDLFSGIGGFSLGLERTGGFETVAFCEIDPFCRRVLAKHWPKVKCYEDVRTLDAPTLRRDGIAVDVIAGGFPCQDVSHAGKRAGLEGARSGLWRDYARLIGELRPRIAIVENVPGLLSDGMGTVLGDLAAVGYDAEWDCIPATAVGAPHRRDRVWIIARDANDKGEPAFPLNDETSGLSRDRAVANASSGGRRKRDTNARGRSKGTRAPQERRGSADDGWWTVEPAVGRVAYGIPKRLDRLRSLGNAVVPQIPELIGRAILQAHGLKSASGTLNTNGESNA